MSPKALLHPLVPAFSALVAVLAFLSGGSPVQRPGLAPEVERNVEEARRLGLYRPAQGMSPGLSRKAEREPGGSVTVWVFLTDKGIGTRATLAERLDRRWRTLPVRARARREALGPEYGVDFRDLPVHGSYVRQLEGRGFAIRRRSRWLNAVSLTTSAGRLADLVSLPFVRKVTPVLRKTAAAPLPEPGSSPVRGHLAPRAVGPINATPAEEAFYGLSIQQLHQIQVLELHRLGYTGAGVRVMMLDTGFRKDHPVFDCVDLVAEYDFVNEDGNTQNEEGDTFSQQNHGTGVWSVAGGYAPGSLIGPAFGAEFVLAKTEDVTQEVQAEEDNYVAALEWGDTLGVDVASASLAYFTFDDSTGYTVEDLDGDTAVITVAVDIAAAKGITCVNSAGNSGPDPTSIWTPADADTVLSVGAVDSCGVIQSFSSRGPTFDNRIKPEISARGRYTRWASAVTLGYGSANGTSLSAPLIAGLAALLKEAHPGWSGYDVREAVIGTGTQNGIPDNDLGYGIAQGLDALGFGAAVAEPPRMTLPFELLSPGEGASLNTVNPTLVWSASEAPGPGDQAIYAVILDDNAGFSSPDTIPAGSDTTLTLSVPVPPGEMRWWRVEATGSQGYARKSMNTRSFEVSPTLGTGPGSELPLLHLGPAFPNPMSARTAFSVRVPENEAAVLEIVSLTGRLVRRIPFTGTGEDLQMEWDGRDARGLRTPAGVYFYRILSSSSSAATRKLVRIP